MVNVYDELLTPTEASIVLGVSYVRVNQLATCGELPSVQTKLGKLYRRVDVDALKERRRNPKPSRRWSR